ncbi:calcium-binding protein [Candidatus Peregrinibacteria bacterium]|nr:MAG: calcium-binding protein [Candidatus Peregrinibacteria bacterium]
MQKTIHFALFLFIVTGLLFTGCASEPVKTGEMQGSLEDSFEGTGKVEDDSGKVEATEQVEEAEKKAPVEEESAYEDGTYTEVGAYTSPAGQESVSVTLVLKEGLVQSVSIGNLATNEASIRFQGLFADGISSLVVGKPIDSLGAIGAVNGSSLTPMGFNAAVEAIRAEASA